MHYDTVFSTKIGKLGIVTSDNYLCSVNFLSPDERHQAPSHKFAKQVQESLLAYFENPHHVFEIPVKIRITDFQARVYKALRNIPSGKVLTYGELAEKLSSHPRAIGQACRRNPIPIIVPCHRVVAKQNLGGFSGGTGEWLPIKITLLEHEGSLPDFNN